MNKKQKEFDLKYKAIFNNQTHPAPKVKYKNPDKWRKPKE
jgi:hypothetical protein